MSVPVICKCLKDLIETEGVMLVARTNTTNFGIQEDITPNINYSMLLDFELLPDFMPALVICSFHKDVIKLEALC